MAQDAHDLIDRRASFCKRRAGKMSNSAAGLKFPLCPLSDRDCVAVQYVAKGHKQTHVSRMKPRTLAATVHHLQDELTRPWGHKQHMGRRQRELKPVGKPTTKKRPRPSYARCWRRRSAIPTAPNRDQAQT
jgi:hypothetical protein